MEKLSKFLVGEHQNSGTSAHVNHEKIKQFKMSNSQMLFAVKKKKKAHTLNDVALMMRKEVKYLYTLSQTQKPHDTAVISGFQEVPLTGSLGTWVPRRIREHSEAYIEESDQFLFFTAL